MDLCGNSGAPGTDTAEKGPVPKQELPLSSVHCQTRIGDSILLQFLDFKTVLLEIVEELQIQRDSKTLFEDQNKKLVLENQELGWKKESLQHQIKEVTNQHTETLVNIQKQFQARISNIEDEKGIIQVSAELKNKEIANLKEVLKSLQLLRYNLEKKVTELEQKLALQSRLKDNHLIQLGEVEKRFTTLSKQFNMFKLGQRTLEQKVNEAMKLNTILTSANGKQKSIIMSLKKELEGNHLIKANMSTLLYDKTQNPTGAERCMLHLRQRLEMESGINLKLREENQSLRKEKLDIMRSLQRTQQLLLSQTQAVRKVEMELQTQKQQCQT